MIVLSFDQINEVSGADAMTACLAVGGTAALVGGLFSGPGALFAGIGGCAVGVAVYYW